MTAEAKPQNAAKQPAMTRRNLLLAAVALAIVGPLIWALRPAAVSVDVATVSRGPMRVTVDEDGKTRVKNVFVVSAPVSGKLQRISLDPGDNVVANETVVATIEPSAPLFLDARTRREAEARVAAAQAAVSLSEAEIKQVETELSWAQSELQRNRTLAQTNVIAARVLERAKLEVEKQQAALARAKANLQVRAAELATAKAHLIGPETAAQQSPSAGGCCVEVRSPQSGRVLKELQESERVVVAGTPLLEIGDPADLELVADLLSTDAVKIPPGAVATIDGAGLPQPLEARVRRVEPSGFTKVSALGIEEQRVRVILDFASPAEAWARLGHDYRVFVRIVTWSKTDALRVPLSALFRSGGKWAVYTEASGRALLTPIEIGQRNAEFAEVLQGLDAGRVIILHPSDRVLNGTRIVRR